MATTHPSRSLRAGLVVAAGIALTACGTQASSAPATTTTPATTAPAATTTSTTPSTTATTRSGTAPTTTAPINPGDGAQPAGCRTADLHASLSAPNGSAGHAGFLLDLTNVGSGACTLFGYPGVSYVTGDTGTQVGAAATRRPTPPDATLVHLGPGQTGQSTVEESDAGNYDPSTCRLTSVRGLRVYPPNQRAALYVAEPTKGCANPALQLIQVGPVQVEGTASI